MKKEQNRIDGPPVDTAEYPIGCVVHATAVIWDENLRQLMFNRDMLPGPKDPAEPAWIWGVRLTKPGSNGYYHEPDWQEFHESRGTACITIGVHEGNRIATFVRVESEEIAKQKGPDAYGYSR